MHSPFAPLWPWLPKELTGRTIYPAAPDATRCRHMVPICEDGRTRCALPVGHREQCNHLGPPHIDLRHGPARYVVLRALADVGHPRPWALGALWSPLTDEQAGRATAAILRAVGPDPSQPVGVVPVCVLDRWAYVPGHEWIRPPLVGENRFLRANDETEHAARDAKARDLGALFIEDLTPEVRHG